VNVSFFYRPFLRQLKRLDFPGNDPEGTETSNVRRANGRQSAPHAMLNFDFQDVTEGVDRVVKPACRYCFLDTRLLHFPNLLALPIPTDIVPSESR
jgi:hypothetical protein